MSAVIRFHATGPADVLTLEDEIVAAPGAGQVRLRQEAIGINFVDTMFRSGAFGAPLPFVTGVEAAGVIDAVGPGVTGFKPGDRVGYFFAPGAYAAERLVAADVLIALPDDLPSLQAAALITKGLTAWMAVKDLFPVKPGHVVLVQGASGGVGALVAAWARDLGATVIGTGSPVKRARVAAVSDHALASDDPNLGETIRALAPGGVDVVYDFVGKAVAQASQAAVADGGAIITIGAASGAPGFDTAALAARGVRTGGGSTGQSVGHRLAAAAAEVFDAYRRGVFGTLDITTFPLSQAAQAHRAIADRTLLGSGVLLP
ncbi:zinc-binding dehydrogenase [Caulobacter sp. CCNWLY153]|uniref:Quinone oxidoreductase n=1 Tax=Caulobacter radicis TaxID=2172650 RepID=A0A2T9IYT9_9CAUL|nr:zinc-binding dehydrogenase [Caulobacter radicis]PVM72355.1 quinone oxidoreductase [Caulobacter radicis]